MSFFDSLIGLIAPSRCVVCQKEGSALCTACANAEIVPYGQRCFNCGVISANGRTCASCRASSPRYVWITTNYENAAQKLLKVYKFAHHRAASSSLASLMVGTMLDFSPIEYLRSLDYLILPVPTATSRQRQRSFDHSTLLAKQIARQLGLRFINGLSRIGQSRQLGAVRSVRLHQLDGSYLVRYPNLIAGKNILLIDDVVTTGATLRAATKALRKAGAARVDSLVFAKKL